MPLSYVLSAYFASEAVVGKVFILSRASARELVVVSESSSLLTGLLTQRRICPRTRQRARGCLPPAATTLQIETHRYPALV